MAATAIDLQAYASLNDGDCDQRIIRAKKALGERVVIPGHHYLRDEIFKHADLSAGCAMADMADLEQVQRAWVLENLVEGSVINHNTVSEKVANSARVASQRMLEIKT